MYTLGMEMTTRLNWLLSVRLPVYVSPSPMSPDSHCYPAWPVPAVDPTPNPTQKAGPARC